MQKTPNIVTKVPRIGKINCLKDSDLIAEHNAIVSRRGSVLFGRIGRRLAIGKVKLIRQAIDAKLTPMLFVVRKGEKDYECFQAEIRGIWDADYEPDMSLCPSYYSELAPNISLWIEIGMLQEVSRKELSNLRLSSTDRPISELLGSQSSLMLADSYAAKNR